MVDVVTNFKRWTTRNVNRENGIVGKQLRQREWFDHWSRLSSYDEAFCKYIRRNPVKAGLCKCKEDWAHGTWSKS